MVHHVSSEPARYRDFVWRSGDGYDQQVHDGEGLIEGEGIGAGQVTYQQACLVLGGLPAKSGDACYAEIALYSLDSRGGGVVAVSDTKIVQGVGLRVKVAEHRINCGVGCAFGKIERQCRLTGAAFPGDHPY